MKSKFNKKAIAIVIIAIAVIIIILSIVLASLANKDEEIPEAKMQEMLEQGYNDNMIIKLSKMTEMQRVETYLSMFISKIEKKEYSMAYEILYSEFKDNYFRTQKDFERYCEEYFPAMFDIQNRNIERVNNIYVLETTIRDLVNNSSNINLYFVIRENQLNDYELSFSVDSAIKAKE